LAILNKKINLNNLKNCDDFINEIDHDNKIDYNSRELLIKNLEKFRFDNVKEKLESLFLKYKNLGNISIDLKVFIFKN
jgi:chaperonin cofactor prefoldin